MDKDVAGLMERLGVYAEYVEYDPPLNYEDAAATTMREAASTIRALDDKLREAVGAFNVIVKYHEEADNHSTAADYYYEIARAFLATMEKPSDP